MRPQIDKITFVMVIYYLYTENRIENIAFLFQINSILIWGHGVHFFASHLRSDFKVLVHTIVGRLNIIAHEGIKLSMVNGRLSIHLRKIF